MSGIALIPARGGSKRIPRKNVRPFLGEPAVARVIRTVRSAGVADRVLVSTDDDEITDVAIGAGAEVPERRPADLADDHTTTIDVVRHAIDTWMHEVDGESLLWVIYPTALLLDAVDLQDAARAFAGSGAEFLVPVLRYPHPVERRLRRTTDGLLRADHPELLSSRSQDLPPAFHDAGQYYLGSVRSWRASSPLAGDRTMGLELAADRAVDIDELEHWERAELLASQRRPSGPSTTAPSTPER